MNASEAVETVGLSMLIFMLDRAGAAADRRGLDRRRRCRDAIEQLQRPHQRRLRLDRDDARAEPAERGDAVADMGADIEHEIAAA